MNDAIVNPIFSMATIVAGLKRLLQSLAAGGMVLGGLWWFSQIHEIQDIGKVKDVANCVRASIATGNSVGIIKPCAEQSSPVFVQPPLK